MSKTSKTKHDKQVHKTAQGRQPQLNMMTVAVVALLMIGGFAAYTLLSAGAPSADPETLAAAAAADNPDVLMATAPQGLAPQDYMVSFREAGVEHLLLDVRTPSEFDSGHIEGAVNIPLQELAARSDELPQDKPIVIYCRSGNRSAQAANLLNGQNFSGLYDMGGTIHWTAAGYPLV